MPGTDDELAAEDVLDGCALDFLADEITADADLPPASGRVAEAPSDG